MSPGDLGPKAELAYGGSITGVALVMHYLNDVVTPVATSVGAIAGAVVGLHAVYRIYRPKKRYGRRADDNPNDF